MGSRAIGPGEPTCIVAEAGVNHDGSLERACALVDAAVAAGADAVKFQVFRAAELATAAAAVARYQRQVGETSQRAMLAKLELSDGQLDELRTYCRRREIDFLATPFGPADVARLRRLDVRAIKIASTDLNNVPLLREAARTQLPLILSTGAALAAEIHATVERLRAWRAHRRLILLHCISCYPAPLEAANLRAIDTLARTFGVPCGFSDHTLSTHTGAWAVAAGACLLEKHLTLDRTATGPDHAMSLSPAELGLYVAEVRSVEAALGNGALGMTALEHDIRAAARKSVVAARALPAGTTLTPDVLAVKRPGGGIEPDHLDALLGRRMAVDVPGDTVLTWDMLV